MHTQVSSNATVLKTASGSAKVKNLSYFKAYNSAYHKGKKKALRRGKSEATLFSIVEFWMRLGLGCFCFLWLYEVSSGFNVVRVL